MAQEDGDAVNSGPQRGTLLRRAHDLLETLGKPADEEILIKHLFGASRKSSSGNLRFWKQLLRQTLNGSHSLRRLPQMMGRARRSGHSCPGV